MLHKKLLPLTGRAGLRYCCAAAIGSARQLLAPTGITHRDYYGRVWAGIFVLGMLVKTSAGMK
ncbi:hypothetical protein [Pectobacterium brasiliense]|uniref:hypothetical protein n=1 Tax=Pectobacterium brasiliense TaxID=180957 RepID=UPI003BF8546B